jgi:cryptochrome
LRYRFLLQSLVDLESQFAAHSIPFFCFHGDPVEILERLVLEWNVKIISFEKDTEAIYQERDALVKQMCAQYSVQVIEKVSHTMYDPDEIFNINNNQPPNTCEALRASCFIIGPPEKPLKRPNIEYFTKNLLSTTELYDSNLHKVSIKKKKKKKKK